MAEPRSALLLYRKRQLPFPERLWRQILPRQQLRTWETHAVPRKLQLTLRKAHCENWGGDGHGLHSWSLSREPRWSLRVSSASLFPWYRRDSFAKDISICWFRGSAYKWEHPCVDLLQTKDLEPRGQDLATTTLCVILSHCCSSIPITAQEHWLANASYVLFEFTECSFKVWQWRKHSPHARRRGVSYKVLF